MRDALKRVLPSGLRWRIAMWVTAVVLVCTGVTFVAVYGGTGSELRARIDRELADDAAAFVHNLRLAPPGPATAVASAASRYIRGQPFGPSSTLVFAQIPGAGVATNRSEVFTFGGADDNDTPSSQIAERRLRAQLLRAGDGYLTLAAAGLGDLRLVKRTVSLARGLRVTVGVAEPLAPVGHAQASVARAFVLALVLALAGALLASYLIGTRMSRPLRRMAAVAARVNAGDLRPRIGDAGASSGEVRVLIEAFDRMLDRLTEAFASQRAFVADASHELRTPLTVMRGQLEVLASQAAPSPSEVRRVERQLQAEIARITRLIDDLLLLTRSEQPRFLRIEAIDPVAFVDELWEGTALLADRRFELGAIPAGTLQADPDRLAQALRNLLDNAVRHTAPGSGLVRLCARSARGSLRFLVEDDGPGIPASERERVFDRFNRIERARDRASGGAGLGLAIVRAIALAHGGAVSAGASAEGGASIEFTLPRFREAERAPLAHDAGVADRVAAGLGPDA
jgi:signal transduction histidine kinase